MGIDTSHVTSPGEGLSPFASEARALLFKEEVLKRFPVEQYSTVLKHRKNVASGMWDVYWFVGIPEAPDFKFSTPGFEPLDW